MKLEATVWTLLGPEASLWTLKGPGKGMLQVLDKTGRISQGVFAFEGGTELRKRMQELLEPFRPAKGMLPVKLISDAALSAELREMLPKLGFHVLRLVDRTGSFEMRFQPANGKLHVSMPEVTEAQAKKGKLRVLIIDDSPLISTILSNILSSDPEIEVVGTVGLPSQVDAAIRNYQPDVITLDLHLPEMTGVELLAQYLPKYNVPTVIISSISPDEGPMVLNALEVGAVDYIQKPSSIEIETASSSILEKVRAAARITPRAASGAVISRAKPGPFPVDIERVIAIGSSTGGTKALREIFLRLPRNIPPIVVVQHIPAGFSAAFAERLNQICEFPVKEAADGDPVIPGRALIAPGGKHLRIVRAGTGRIVRVEDGPHVNSHRPSVDVLFHSLAELGMTDTIGVLLTGMGNDGARGLLALKNLGCTTIAQDEASCVVFGMPQAAALLGAAGKIVSLFDIAQTLLDEVTKLPKAGNGQAA